jgi:hypothetical protein
MTRCTIPGDTREVTQKLQKGLAHSLALTRNILRRLIGLTASIRVVPPERESLGMAVE